MWSSALRSAAVRGKPAFTASSATAHVVRRTMADNVSSTTSSVSCWVVGDTCGLYAKYFEDVLRENTQISALAVCS